MLKKTLGGGRAADRYLGQGPRVNNPAVESPEVNDPDRSNSGVNYNPVDE